MARWRLRSAHYLNVPGTEWEYKETDRTTGKNGRKVFPVPLFLNPDDAADHNYPREGEIIVCHEGKGAAKDIIFLGEPTPEMEPIDEEAEAISASLASKWQHPIESLSGQGPGYTQSLLAGLEKQLSDAIKNQLTAPAAPVPTNSVSAEDFNKLQEQVATLMARNAELESAQPAPKAPVARRA